MNMYVWLILAGMVDYDNGFFRTFAMHTTAILGGAFGVGWEARLTHTNLVVGASGGDYGMLSSIISDLVLNWNEMNRFKRLFYTGVLIDTIASEIITNTIYYNPMISYSNHVGGFLYGIVSSLLFSRNIKIDKWEKTMQYIVGAFIFLITMINFFNLLFIGQ